MHKNRLASSISAALLAAVTPILAHAQVYTWASPTSASWSDPNRWVGAAAPVGGIGVELHFGSPTTTSYTATNDLGAFVLSRMVFNNNSRGSDQVTSRSGSGITFDGTARIDVTGVSPMTLAAASGSTGVTLNTNVAVNMASLGSLTISAPVGGTGGFTITGSEIGSHVGSFYLNSGVGANTFSGPVTLNSGNLLLQGINTSSNPLGLGALHINGGYLGFLGSGARIANTINLNTDLRITTGTGRIAGTVNVNNASAGMQLFGSTLNLDSPIAIQGATVLGENDRYAASTGPAQLNLAANGALLNTSAITAHAGATIVVDDSATNSTDRLNDSATLTLNSASVSFRANNVGSAETVGATKISGFSVLEARPGTAAPFGAGTLTLTSLTRSDHGVVFVRGQNLGVPTAAPTSATAFAIINVANGAPALVGGNGADGTTNISIVPWAVAAYSTTSSTSSSPNTFATYGPNGFRPLNPATEFATALGSDPTQNVILTAALTTNNSEASVNSLLLSSAGSLSVTGTGTISINSGALLLATGVSGSSISNALNFGSAEAVVTTGGPLTVSGSLYGSGGFTKAGSSPLILTANNTGLTGPLTIAGNSNIQVSDESNLPGTGAITIHAIASTFPTGIGVSDKNGTITTPITIGRDIVLDSGLCSLSTLNATTDAVFSGTISGKGSLGINTTSSFGLVELTGINTYEGITRVHGGSLRIHSDANLGNGGALVLATPATTQGIELAGDWITSRRVDVLSGSAIQTYQYNAILNGPVTGTSALSKYGSGALVLNADSSYAGTLNVLEGSLFVNAVVPMTVTAQGASLATPTLLGGDGRMGDVTILGIIAPGADLASAGILEASSFILKGESTLAFDLGSGGDLLLVDNALTKNTSTGTDFVFQFNPLSGITAGATYDLIRFGTTTFTAADFTYTGPGGLTGTFNMTTSALQFTVISVPEPGHAIAAVAGISLLRRRRRTLTQA